MRNVIRRLLGARLPLAATLIGGIALHACGEESAVQPPPPSVASVVVTATVDSLIALGRMAQLTATATDGQGTSVSGAAFTWESSDAAVATVNATGLVTSVAAGSVTITATSEGVSGSLKMRVVEADLTGIGDLLADPYVLQLIAQVNENTAARLRDALLEVSLSVTQGNLSAVHSALTTAQSEVMGSADANDVVLFAVLRLVLDHAERLLNL